jgi:hypothetical protein
MVVNSLYREERDGLPCDIPDAGTLAAESKRHAVRHLPRSVECAGIGMERSLADTKIRASRFASQGAWLNKVVVDRLEPVCLLLPPGLDRITEYIVPSGGFSVAGFNMDSGD